MAWDKLDLYNRALDHCGETALVTLTENREPRRLLDRAYNAGSGIIKYCLEQGQWQFGVDTQEIEADTGIEPDFGYRYAFQRPDDYVRTVALSDNEYFSGKFNDWVDEAGFWYADIDTIYLKFVSMGANFGANFALWPESFGEYVAAELAWRIIPRLTTSRSSREDMATIKKEILSSAQGKDALNRPVVRMGRGAWNDARLGRYSTNRERG